MINSESLSFLWALNSASLLAEYIAASMVILAISCYKISFVFCLIFITLKKLKWVL